MIRAAAAVLLLLAPVAAQAVLGPMRCGMGRDYWLQEPKVVDPKRTYWLVVLAHGFRGAGKDILWLRRSFARFDDFITVAPSFPEGFQLLEAKTDQQLIGLSAALRKRYRLHDKLFVCGFSAGAQFSHRFTMRHPDRVVGCSAHSGGTWGPGVDVRARGVPMTLSCGLDDAQRSSLGQQMSRVQAAHRYFQLLADRGFHVKARLWPGVGHATSPEIEASIAECYLLATRGLYVDQAVALGKRVAAARARRGEARRRMVVGWTRVQFPEPGAKRWRRSVLGREARAAHAILWRLQGIGGRSIDGRRYWIDDRGENVAGWYTNELSVTRRVRALSRHLAAQQRALLHRD